MSNALFVPKRQDGRPYWQVAFDRFCAAGPGEIVPHEELLRLLAIEHRPTLYNSVGRAARELRKRRQRTISVIRGLGYRILYANEHVGQADGHRSRAERQLRTATEVIDATDLNALDAKERATWSDVKRGMAMLYLAVSSHAETLARHEELIHSLGVRVEELETNVPVSGTSVREERTA